MKNLLIWGAGDQGTVTLDCALAMDKYARIDFLDMKEKGRRDIPGYCIYSEADVNLNTFLSSYDEVIIATGSNTLREQKFMALDSLGVPSASIIHPSAIVSPFANISKGCTVLPYAVIHTNANIGAGCIINTHAVVEHDCIVHDFVNICPKVSMAGHVEIGKKAYLGIGCTLIDNINVGNNAVIGAGAVIIRDVPPDKVAAGVPGKIIR